MEIFPCLFVSLPLALPLSRSPTPSLSRSPHSRFPTPDSPPPIFFPRIFLSLVIFPTFRGVISVRIAMSGLLSRLFAAVGFARYPNYSSRDRRRLRLAPVGVECEFAPSWARSQAQSRSAAPVLFPASALRRFR